LPAGLAAAIGSYRQLVGRVAAAIGSCREREVLELQTNWILEDWSEVADPFEFAGRRHRF